MNAMSHPKDNKAPSPDVVQITEDEIERERERVRLSPLFTIIFSGTTAFLTPSRTTPSSFLSVDYCFVLSLSYSFSSLYVANTYICVIGFALMSDGYQVGVLSLINVCFAKIYGDAYTSEMSTRLGNALFVGIVLGQVPFFYV